MFAFSEVLAYPFSVLFLRDNRQLILESVHVFRVISYAYMFTGMAIFGSAFMVIILCDILSKPIE